MPWDAHKMDRDTPSRSRAEVARERDDVIRRMLATPPKPHAPLKAKTQKPKKKKGAAPKRKRQE